MSLQDEFQLRNNEFIVFHLGMSAAGILPILDFVKGAIAQIKEQPDCYSQDDGLLPNNRVSG